MAYPPCSAEDTVENAIDAIVRTNARGDGVETDFLLDGAAGTPVEQTEVTIDGAMQAPTDDYTVEDDGPDLRFIFDEAPADEAVLFFRAYR